MIDRAREEGLEKFFKQECMLEQVQIDTSLFVSGLLDSLDFVDLLEFLVEQGIPKESLEGLEYNDLDTVEKILAVMRSSHK